MFVEVVAKVMYDRKIQWGGGGRGRRSSFSSLVVWSRGCRGVEVRVKERRRNDDDSFKQTIILSWKSCLVTATSMVRLAVSLVQ